MLGNILAEYINISVYDIDQMLAMTGLELYQHGAYKKLVRQLKEDQLVETMDNARQLLDQQLPLIVDRFKNQYDLEEFPLNGFMLVNWVIGYIHSPNALPRLLKIHEEFPKNVMRDIAPEVLDIFNGLSRGHAEWQRAFATLIIPLIAK